MTSPHEQALAAATAAIQEIHFDSHGSTHEIAEAAITAYLAALPAPDLADGVGVKPLKWLGDGIWLKAYAPFGGIYRITEYSGMAKPFKLEISGFVGSSGHFELADEAKAAAQADYERRILSAIDTTALSARLAAVERERDEADRSRTFHVARAVAAEGRVKALDERLAEMEAGR